MLQTPHGKTALDLAYGAGRSKVLIDILPTEQMLTLLQRIDDVVPRDVRKLYQETNILPGNPFADLINNADKKRSSVAGISARPYTQSSVNMIPDSPTGSEIHQNRQRLGYSMIRRAVGSQQSVRTPFRKQSRSASHQDICPWDKPSLHKEDPPSAESIQMLNIWRKILLNDDVELLDTLRDSMIWRNNVVEGPVVTIKRTTGSSSTSQVRRKSSTRNVKNVDDFESAQGISQSHMVELFNDCYENGIGVYSHVQATYGSVIKQRGLRMLLRSLTGMQSFKHLTTSNGVIIFRPMYLTILFLAVLCGRFRIAEALLRMRQSELESFANMAEGIAVDVLSQVYLKDNTIKKAVCRDFLNVPLRSFGEVSIVDLCATAKCTALLSLPCCQRVLDQRWEGVLSYLPGSFRFISRFCPLFGLIHLEERARKERTKALLDCIAATATHTINSPPIGPHRRDSDRDPSLYLLRDRRSVITGQFSPRLNINLFSLNYSQAITYRIKPHFVQPTSFYYLAVTREHLFHSCLHANDQKAKVVLNSTA
ncbi:hypothetical protein Ciccas_007802 [Cichlidogyrus casuarinus]|uniref:ANK_REP_REGION domain-containing protein n=1 Tax=Cichlidogyrus casuarinus TaxID=1844966 RepID=A0ABD2Q5X8_9PLAT